MDKLAEIPQELRYQLQSRNDVKRAMAHAIVSDMLDKNIEAIRQEMRKESFGYPSVHELCDKYLSPVLTGFKDTIDNLEYHLHVRTFEAFKAELKKAGYKKLYVGAFPGNSFLAGPSHLFAAPKRKCDSFARPFKFTGPQGPGWPAIWRISDEFYKTGCGNGLRDADQRQLNYPLPAFLQGEHEL